MTTCFGQK